MALPSEGTRLSLSGYIGTIKFIGEVDNTNGNWLGVEWDDPQRGKHDGCKDGKRYFTCRVSNAGSFIRPSTSVYYGASFLQALSSKYIELLHHSGSQEQVVLGSSNGAIQVEAVNLDKIRGKFANLFNLREVSVDNQNVATCDPEGEIRKTCPNVRGLDLSSSLLPSWDVVATITAELPLLERLALNRNRLQPMRDIAKGLSAFVRLTDLQLNGTLMTWRQMQDVTALMPNLRLVEMGYNRLRTLSPFGQITSTIQVINLDTNECHDWTHICQAMTPYAALQRLILTSNGIAAITPCLDYQPQLKGLKHISLSFNRLSSWTDIDALSRWCPALETLTLIGNPLVEDHKLSKYSRQFAIARISSLVTLDAAGISLKERMDCELFYLSYIVRHGPKGEEERCREHPRWAELCLKHGRLDEISSEKDGQDKLGNRIIQLNISTYPGLSSESSMVLRVLPTMTLRAFRLKVGKLAKIPTLRSSQRSAELWLRMADGSLSQLSRDQNEQNLAWWGFENDSDVIFDVEHE